MPSCQKKRDLKSKLTHFNAQYYQLNQIQEHFRALIITDDKDSEEDEQHSSSPQQRKKKHKK